MVIPDEYKAIMAEALRYEEDPIRAMKEDLEAGLEPDHEVTDKDGKPMHDLTIAELRKEKKQINPKNCVVLKDGFWA